MKWHFTDGWTLGDFTTVLSKADSYKLADDEKRPFINVVMSAASKTLTLDLATGDCCVVYNSGGTNAITIKNVSGDTGTSLAAGKVAYVMASRTADASAVKVLN